MRTTEELSTEHKAVIVALGVMERVEDALAAGEEDAADHLGQLLEFFRGFVDRCHHAKEEEILFPAMEREGMAHETGPIGHMLEEHDTGRRHLRAITEGLARWREGDRSALRAIQQNGSAYRELLRDHIQKEEEVLFPMADRIVPPERSEVLMARFEAIERERVGVGKHEEYHAMLHRLRDHYEPGGREHRERARL